MAIRLREDGRLRRACFLLLVFFFVFLVIIIVNEIAVFLGLVVFFLVVLFVLIIGDQVQVDGVRLRDVQFRFALGTAKDRALVYFVFVDIDFCGSFSAPCHRDTRRKTG